MDHQTSNIPFQKVISLLDSFSQRMTNTQQMEEILCLAHGVTRLYQPVAVGLFPTNVSPTPPASPFTCPCVGFLIKRTKGNGNSKQPPPNKDKAFRLPPVPRQRSSEADKMLKNKNK